MQGEMEKFHLQQQLVSQPDDAVIAQMIKEYEMIKTMNTRTMPVGGMQGSQLKKVDESLSEQNESDHGGEQSKIIGGQMQLAKDHVNPVMMPPPLDGNLVGSFDPEFTAEIEFYQR